jgi:hypothetical protein
MQRSKYHCHNYKIDGQTKDKCWKLHPETNLKNCNKEHPKKKKMLDMDSGNQIESNYDVNENIVHTILQMELNTSNPHQNE